MKTILLLLVLALLCGCERKNIELIKLKSEVESLKSEVVFLKADIVYLMESDTNTMNMFGVYNKTFDHIEAGVRELGGRVSAIESNPVWAADSPPARSTSRAMKSGVPIAVYNQIAAEAVKKWPGKYDMQVWEIEQQTSAYQKLHQ